MKTIIRQISELERRSAGCLDEHGRTLADAIRERRSRRLAAEGRPPEQAEPRDVSNDPDRPRTIAETIRAHFQTSRPRSDATVPSHHTFGPDETSKSQTPCISLHFLSNG